MRKFLSLVGIGLFALCAAAQQPEQSLADVYGQLTGRTVLYGDLPVPALSSIKAQIQADTNKAIQVIEAELAKHKIDCVRDGEKFVRWLPTGWKDTEMGAQLARLKPPTNNPASSTSAFAAGGISFPNISLDQVVEVFASLSKRTVMPPLNAPPVTLHIKTQTPLSTNEMVYAFKTLFILNGFVAVENADKSIELVPIRRASGSKTKPSKSPTATPPGVNH